MVFQLQHLAERIEASIEGNADIEIRELAKIESAGPGSLSFLANPKYLPHLYTTQASAVIVADDLKLEKAVEPSLLRCKDPYQAFASLLDTFYPEEKPEPGIDPLAFVHPEATIGQEVHIGAFCFIGAGVVIGDGCIIHPQVYIGNQVSVGNETVIYPQVRIYHQCQVGAHCIIHGGTTIGSDGFGFAPNAEGQYVKVRQTGNVIVEDHVEIGSNCCLDRATLGSTVIKKGAKLDNLVQIAHNVVIGENSVLAAQAGIAGSTQLGKSVMVGGQAGFIGHLHIADYTMIDAQSGVNKSIKKPGQAFRGSPIQSYRQQLKSEVFFRKLEAMQRKIDELEKALKAKD